MNICVTTPGHFSADFSGITRHLGERCAHFYSRSGNPERKMGRGKRGSRTPLPGMFISNVSSLSNKLNKTPAAGGERQSVFVVLRFVLHGDKANGFYFILYYYYSLLFHVFTTHHDNFQSPINVPDSECNSESA